jgi:hypothetical protein
VSTSHTYIYVSTPPPAGFSALYSVLERLTEKGNYLQAYSLPLNSGFYYLALQNPVDPMVVYAELFCVYFILWLFVFFSFSNFRAIIFFQVHVHRCLHIQRTATVHTPFKDWVQQRLFLLPSVTLNRKLKNDGQGCWSSKKRYCYCLGGNKLASIIF